MGKYIWRAVATLAVLLLAGARPAGSQEWLADIDEGKRLAAKQDKDLLINFTGTEWCRACIVLRREVLDRPEFAAARERFVLVELEFPSSRDEVLAKPREKFRAWQKHYGVHAFPTILLTDAAGKPYAITGCIRGTKPKDYVERLGKLREVHTRRDAALAKAAATEGVTKARYLDEALSALHKAFTEDASRGEEKPLVRFYRPEIDQVLALDAAGTAGLREKYRRLLDAEAERTRTEDIFNQIAAVGDKEGLDKAIVLIDRKFAGQISQELRRRLQWSRKIHLEWSDRYEESLAYCKELLWDEAVSVEERRLFRQSVAFNLTQLGRINEAIAVYDGLIGEVATDRKSLFQFHCMKAAALTTAGRLGEASDAWVDARRYVEPGTFDWFEAAGLHARLMMQVDRFADAEAVHDQLLKSDAVSAVDKAIILTDAAGYLSKAGRHKEALEKANRAEELLAGTNLRGDDIRTAKWVRSRIETARDKAAAEGKKGVNGR